MLQKISSDVTTISDVYKDDVPEGAIFVAEYPVSQRHFYDHENVLINNSKYLIDDGLQRISPKEYFVNRAHSVLPVMGHRLRTVVPMPPSLALIGHWERRLAVTDVVERLANLGDAVPHICVFPLQQLPAELHAVNPDVHYAVHSKAFITEIDCPQAPVLTELKIPSMLKVCRGSGGSGTFLISKRDDYDYWIRRIGEVMPWAETILTELIADVEHDLGCHLYISKAGEVSWIAAVEKIFDDSHTWIGAGLRMSEQDEFRRIVSSAIKPVAAALHSRGYFGLVGIDVLLDGDNRPYVVDINPRKLGGSSLVFTQLKLQKLGRIWDAAVCLKIVVRASSVDEVLAKAEGLVGDDGELIVFSVYEMDVEDAYGCNVGVFGRSIEECQRTIALLKS